MQLTIVPNENLVVIDRRAAKVTLSDRADLKDVEAIKWDDALGYGFIEYANKGPRIDARSFRGTDRITDLAPYQSIIDAHREIVAADDAKHGAPK